MGVFNHIVSYGHGYGPAICSAGDFAGFVKAMKARLPKSWPSQI